VFVGCAGEVDIIGLLNSVSGADGGGVQGVGGGAKSRRRRRRRRSRWHLVVSLFGGAAQQRGNIQTRDDQQPLKVYEE